MDPDSRRAETAATVNGGSPSSIAPEIYEEAIWQMNLREMEPAPYSQHGEPDCGFYTRKLYYLRTGNCKYGTSCKFHHPIDKVGVSGLNQLYILDYPLRLGEMELLFMVSCLSNTIRERGMNNMLAERIKGETELLFMVSCLSNTIRERGMNNMLAERIKDFLNRPVRDHGSIDFEWLRDIPPDKAKENARAFSILVVIHANLGQL